jgi:hypothetical protein
LRHFASENIAWRVAKEIDQAVNLFHHVVPFPDEIWDEMQDHRKLIRERYETTIQELRKILFFSVQLQRRRPAARICCRSIRQLEGSSALFEVFGWIPGFRLGQFIFFRVAGPKNMGACDPLHTQTGNLG